LWEQIRAGKMVVVADLGAAHTAEKFLCPIRASAIETIRFLVIDTLHFEAAMKLIQLTDSSALTTVPLAMRARARCHQFIIQTVTT
jgi:hypothetical protein